MNSNLGKRRARSRPGAGAKLEALADELLEQRLITTTDARSRAKFVLGTSPQRIGVERVGHAKREHALDATPSTTPVRIALERAK